MKYAAVLLLTIFSATVYAQPVYRCETGPGQIAYQDQPCAEPAQATTADVAIFEARDYGQGGWSDEQRRQRRIQARSEARTETMRVRMLQKPANDRKAAEYAENHLRCQNAMRIAALCGKFAGRFSCDEKGFRPEPVRDISAPRLDVVDNGSAFKMEQCALQAAKGG